MLWNNPNDRIPRWDQRHSAQSEQRWGYSLVSPVSWGKHQQLRSLWITTNHCSSTRGQICSSTRQANPRTGPWPAWMSKTEVMHDNLQPWTNPKIPVSISASGITQPSCYHPQCLELTETEVRLINVNWINNNTLCPGISACSNLSTRTRRSCPDIENTKRSVFYS